MQTFVRLMIMFTLAVAAADSRAQAKPEDQLLPEPPPPDCNNYIMQNRPVFNAKQRACHYFSNIISPSGTFGSLFFAGIAQWRDDPPEWGQGMHGFGRRFGTRYAQGIAKSTGEFVFGEVFREDPRMLPSTKAGFWGRSLHALVNPLVVEVPKKRFAVSRLAGALSSGFAGRAWYPDRLNSIGQAFARSGSAMGGYVGSSFFTEFRPDFLNLVGRIFGAKPDPKTKTKIQTEK